MSAGTPLRRILAGGDRRSIAQSAQALSAIRKEPARVAELASLTADDDWLVSMRAYDLLEKMARERIEWVEPYKGLFLGAAAVPYSHRHLN